ncbi:hypothetical protein J4233_02480 [Candidatus Pacearchaeota archaeon]|nr:hypothetical protein [Candidatus Pacearchaeota archaeon]
MMKNNQIFWWTIIFGIIFLIMGILLFAINTVPRWFSIPLGLAGLILIILASIIRFG